MLPGLRCLYPKHLTPVLTNYNYGSACCMCENKFFKKLFIFSSIFLMLSLVANSVIVYAAFSTDREKSTAQVIQNQQEKIIHKLKKMDKKVKKLRAKKK